VQLKELIGEALGKTLAPETRLAIAVSGGPDSLGLLALAHAALPGRVTALTVDHGLRAGSAAEAAQVASLCAAAGIPHHVLSWPGPHPRANLQAAARAARYALMADWCQRHDVPVLLTAHHAEDQAETLLMRLARGSGLAGLSGIRAARPLAPGVMLVRPLLTTPRTALADAARAAGWTAIDDPSNRHPRHDRTHVRALLAREPGLLPASMLATSAACLAEAEAALDWATDRAFESRVTQHANGLGLDLAGLPQALQHRLLVRAFAQLGAAPRGSAVARLLARGGGTLAGLRLRAGAGLRLRAGPPWTLTPAPPRKS
jgi:tRNA(Ile)-lysidine synthase